MVAVLECRAVYVQCLRIGCFRRKPLPTILLVAMTAAPRASLSPLGCHFGAPFLLHGVFWVKTLSIF